MNVIKKRWVLLSHVFDSSKKANNHFDLLLEDGLECRSWRLNSIPQIDGPAVIAILIPAHRLDWLESSGQKVSGGRGWAQPVCRGSYKGVLPLNHLDPFFLELSSHDYKLRMRIEEKLCQFFSI